MGMKERWVYSLTPREVKGDADALVCVVDNSSLFFQPDIACCQVKHLKKMFDYARKREEAFKKGERIPECFSLVDYANYFDVIAKLQPDMWRRNAHDGLSSDYDCTYKEGVTKENFAESCRLYNRYNNLWCELDDDNIE